MLPPMLTGALALLALGATGDDQAPAVRSSGTYATTGDCEDVIDFNAKRTGAVITKILSAGGQGPVLVSGYNPQLGRVEAAVIFDSANPTGEDEDLGTPNETFGGPGIGAAGEQGMPFQNDTALENVLIVAEDLVDADGNGFVDDPDDADRVGASLSFDFSALGPVAIQSITVLDVEPDRPAPVIDFFGPDDAYITTIPLATPGDNGKDVHELGVGGVHTMVISLDGSGAVDDICFAVDCNGNGVADSKDIRDGTSADCNDNDVPDECDIAFGTSLDENRNGVPDECEAERCWIDAIGDECGDFLGDHSWVFEGIGDFVLIRGGEFVELPDGTAYSSGMIELVGDPDKRFAYDVTLSGRVDPGAADYPPAGSPKKELFEPCYVEDGGSIDTNSWYYYTSTTGSLVGLRDWAGAEIQLVETGPAFQIGDGADGKNVLYGGSVWLDWLVTKQPDSGDPLPVEAFGDINVDIVDCPR